MTISLASDSGRLRSSRAAAVGNALEWFDWTLYGTFSVYLSRNLFDKTDPRSALLSTLAVFAVGFVARPVGGLVLGRLGDRFGRKNVMVLTMALLTASSVGMALIPDCQHIGILASALLLSFRLLQELTHGGETGVSYTYVAAIAPKKSRGLWSSSVFVSVTIGVMAADFHRASQAGDAGTAVATLYAVWNDALMDGRQLFHWLDWMRRSGLTPRGQGSRVLADVEIKMARRDRP